MGKGEDDLIGVLVSSRETRTLKIGGGGGDELMRVVVSSWKS